MISPPGWMEESPTKCHKDAKEPEATGTKPSLAVIDPVWTGRFNQTGQT